MKKALASRKSSVSTHAAPPSAPAGMRRFVGLIGYLTKAEVDAIFSQNPIFTTSPSLSPTELWREFNQRVITSQPADVGIPEVLPVPEEAIPVAEQVRLRPSYKRWYEAVHEYTFAIVPFDQLLAPQWEADMDYVDEITQQAPHPSDWSGAFAFAMQEGSIGAPVVNQNQVIFSSHRRDLFCNQIPEVRPVEAGVYEIIVTAQSRPNYIQVARFGNRLILTNGGAQGVGNESSGFFSHSLRIQRRQHAS